MFAPRKQPHVRDPFRTLAIVTILIGLAMIVGAAVFWALTDRQSSLIMGAGMTLAIGGGLRNMLANLADRFPTIEPPPSPPPSEPPVPPTSNGNGNG